MAEYGRVQLQQLYQPKEAARLQTLGVPAEGTPPFG